MNVSRVARLREASNPQTLHQCLLMDVRDCQTFIEAADEQLRLFHPQGAERALRNAERCYRSVLRGWSQVDRDEMRQTLEPQVAAITASLNVLRSRFDLVGKEFH
jgi:hypothetical protein